jgi:multidrug resistance efflux pump
LGISLGWRDEMLVFYDPETGEYLRNLREEQTARENAEANLQNAEGALRAERAAREAAEARIRQLEEELRRRQGEN